MGKRLAMIVTLLALALLAAPGAKAEGVKRALVMGFDTFQSQPSTTPSSANNVTLMANALSGGSMNLYQLVTHLDDLATTEAFAQAVQEAFDGATDEDINYFYISTHGVWQEGMSNGALQLLLSDGTNEGSITAWEMRRIFDAVPGTKVLLIDACRSGAMLGKGVHGPLENVFQGDDYKVLCSSGGAEESWFWSGETGDGLSSGAGYFSGALVNGITPRGSYGADVNDDGEITLREMINYLLENHGASTPQVYPEEDDFILFTYDADSFTGRRREAAMEGISFDSVVLTGDSPRLDFHFTMLRPVQVIYQLVYFGPNGWQFETSQFIYDNAERYGIYGDQPGVLSPGVKERSLSLNELDSDDYGYVLVQILTREQDKLTVQTSRVICVPPSTGDPLMEALVPASFSPETGQELTLVVHHQYPCELTIWVDDAEGNTVRRLTSRRATRPQQLRPLGTTLSWNGKLRDGSMAPEGTYRFRIRANIGSEVYELISPTFTLLSPQG